MIQSVADFVSDIVEIAGNSLQYAVNKSLYPADEKSRKRSYRTQLINWLGSTISGVTDLSGGLIKSAGGIVGGTISFIVKFPAAIFLFNKKMLFSAFSDVISAVTGAVTLFTGQALSLAQRLFVLQNFDRPLTSQEQQFLKIIFGHSLAFHNIRIIEKNSGLFRLPDLLNRGARPFALGNTIYMKNTGSTYWKSVLVHECVHVWQYQHFGPRYTTDALWAQGLYGSGPGGAYDWKKEIKRGKTDWLSFNKEAQAEFVQNVWDSGLLHASFQSQGLTTFASDTIKMIHSFRNRRWSNSW